MVILAIAFIGSGCHKQQNVALPDASALIADTANSKLVERAELEYYIWWPNDNYSQRAGWFVKGDTISYPNLHLEGTFALNGEKITINLPGHPNQTFMIRRRGKDTLVVYGSGWKELQGVFHNLSVEPMP